MSREAATTSVIFITFLRSAAESSDGRSLMGVNHMFWKTSITSFLIPKSKTIQSAKHSVQFLLWSWIILLYLCNDITFMKSRSDVY
jgi:hypothetical protein